MGGTVVINSSTMIRGLVRAANARTVSPSERSAVAGKPSSSASARRSSRDGSRRATTARATMVAQISAETATWAARAHVASSVTTLSAPTATCASTSTSTSVDRRTSLGERGRIVRARTMHQATKAVTAIARSRCANIGPAPGRLRSGTRRPLMSGQSRNARPAPSART